MVRPKTPVILGRPNGNQTDNGPDLERNRNDDWSERRAQNAMTDIHRSSTDEADDASALGPQVDRERELGCHRVRVRLRPFVAGLDA